MHRRALVPRHCEERSDEAIQSTRAACFYRLPRSLRSLAMTRCCVLSLSVIARERILAGLNEVNAPCEVGRWNAEIRRISKWNARPTERQKSKTADFGKCAVCLKGTQHVLRRSSIRVSFCECKKERVVELRAANNPRQQDDRSNPVNRAACFYNLYAMSC